MYKGNSLGINYWHAGSMPFCQCAKLLVWNNFCIMCQMVVKRREQDSCRVSEELSKGSVYNSTMLARKRVFCQPYQGLLYFV